MAEQDRFGQWLDRRRQAGQDIVAARQSSSARSQWDEDISRLQREVAQQRWAEGYRPSLFRPWSGLWFLEKLWKLIVKSFKVAPATFVWGVLLLFGLPWWIPVVVTALWLAAFGATSPKSPFKLAAYSRVVRADGVLNVAPIFSDISRWRFRRRVEKEKRLGADWLIAMGLAADYEEAFACDPWLLEGDESNPFVLGFTYREPGATPQVVQEKVEHGLPAVTMAEARLFDYTSGEYIFNISAEPQPDATREVHRIDAPMEIADVQKLSVPVGLDRDGSAQRVSLGGNSGMVVAGLPGKGKTAGSVGLISPFLLSDFVDVHVIDCKGGADWQWARPMATYFNNDDEDLQAILDHLLEMQTMMRQRVKSQKEMFGDSNFWHLQRSAEHRAQVIVIDECQTVFEAAGRPKAEKVIIEQITAVVRDLIKKGRSAGFLTLLITQKPTSDAVPTSIRDVCGLRVSFYVSTPEMSTAVLGVLPEAAPSPVDIDPTNVGCSVMATDEGDFEMVKWFYLPEDRAEAAVLAAAQARGLDGANAEFEE